MVEKVVILVLLIVVFLSVIGAAIVYGDNGPTFSFGAPEAIALNPLNGKIAPERNVRFPNVLPFQFYAERQVQPLLSPGDDIAIVLGDDVEIMAPHMIRLNGQPLSGAGKNVRASYFFYIDWPLALEFKEYNSYLRVKIISARATAWHQTGDSGEWFWLRDYYDVEIWR